MNCFILDALNIIHYINLHFYSCYYLLTLLKVTSIFLLNCFILDALNIIHYINLHFYSCYYLLTLLKVTSIFLLKVKRVNQFI
ncbi:hypothetical protein CV680_05535 [Borreliella burgdorferi]|nr:hypothetical protein CV680_05535 [Borreliella burgdorferi]